MQTWKNVVSEEAKTKSGPTTAELWRRTLTCIRVLVLLYHAHTHILTKAQNTSHCRLCAALC